MGLRDGCNDDGAEGMQWMEKRRWLEWMVLE